MEVKPIVKHVLSKELQLYYERITTILLTQRDPDSHSPLPPLTSTPVVPTTSTSTPTPTSSAPSMPTGGVTGGPQGKQTAKLEKESEKLE
jgi:hypothetical protein